jgi:protein-histidine pros-kinase
MSLLLRLNLALVVVFALGTVLTALGCRALLERNAEREIRAEADLMMDSAFAAREYTSNQIAPLLQTQMQKEFLPQSVPAYAATEQFLHLHANRPDYSYQEATLNPTNLRDLAKDWQADIIQRFQDQPATSELTGERDTPMGRSMYLARPIRATAECLSCHSTAAGAPTTVIARYGSNNGFGWHLGDVVGAQVVSVPLASAEDRANRAFRAFLGSLIAMFAALLLVVNLVLYFLVLRPVRRMARIADRLSVGEGNVPAFPTDGSAEIAALGRAFNRMRTSLDKALKLLEA